MTRPLTILCAVWTVVGLSLAASGLGSVNPDARWLVGAATVIGVSAAALATWRAALGDDRAAALLLVLSVIIPTWFAAAVNLVPLVVGIVVAVRGRRTAPVVRP